MHAQDRRRYHPRLPPFARAYKGWRLNYGYVPTTTLKTRFYWLFTLYNGNGGA